MLADGNPLEDIALVAANVYEESSISYD